MHALYVNLHDNVRKPYAGCTVPASVLHRLHAATESIADAEDRSCTRAWLHQVHALHQSVKACEHWQQRRVSKVFAIVTALLHVSTVFAIATALLRVRTAGIPRPAPAVW